MDKDERRTADRAAEEKRTAEERQRVVEAAKEHIRRHRETFEELAKR